MDFEETLTGADKQAAEYMMQYAIHQVQTHDRQLEKFLNQLVNHEGIYNETAIMLEIGHEKNQLFANVVGLLSAMSFIYFAAMKGVRNKVISPIAYAELVETLYAIGFPKVDHFDFPRNAPIDSMDEYIDLQAKRERAIEVLSAQPDGAALIDSLGLNRTLPNPEQPKTAFDDADMFALLENMIKFLSLPHNLTAQNKTTPVSYLASIMIRVINELGLLPGVNSGFAVLKTLSKRPGESEEAYIQRVDGECRRLSSKFERKIDKALASMVICPRMFGELAVNGILPKKELDSTDRTPEVQNLLEALRAKNETYQ